MGATPSEKEAAVDNSLNPYPWWAPLLRISPLQETLDCFPHLTPPHPFIHQFHPFTVTIQNRIPIASVRQNRHSLWLVESWRSLFPAREALKDYRPHFLPCSLYYSHLLLPSSLRVFVVCDRSGGLRLDFDLASTPFEGRVVWFFSSVACWSFV